MVATRILFDEPEAELAAEPGQTQLTRQGAEPEAVPEAEPMAKFATGPSSVVDTSALAALARKFGCSFHTT